MPKKTLTDDEMHTLEIESIINSRPLTDVPLEPNEISSLTPNHLLRVNHEVALSPFQTGEDDCYSRQRFCVVQFTADEFWKRWIVEYPRTILTRSKWHEKKRNFLPDDVVLLLDTPSLWGQWLLGKVIKTFLDRHDNVRTVLVKTTNGSLKKPSRKLCLVIPTKKCQSDCVF